MKKGLLGLVAGIGLTVGGFTGYNYFASPEYKKGQELNKKARIVLDGLKNWYNGEKMQWENNTATYQIEKDKLSVSMPGNGWNWRLFEINDEIRLISEGFSNSDTDKHCPDDDARYLDLVKVNVNGQWMEKEPTKELQALYESYLVKIADVKERIYKEKMHILDTKLKSLSK